MNRALWGTVAALLASCTPADKDLRLDVGDVADYTDWLIERGEDVDPIPFTADPLVVEADGIVRATPDIAVIVATLANEDINEARAVDAVSQTLNAVQLALRDHTVETGFTALSSKAQYPRSCVLERSAAWQRHNQILRDYNFNRRLDQRGDMDTKRRPARPRVVVPDCRAESIRVETSLVVRVSPAEDAGAILNALGDAGAETAQLYGYDFSDYDALYSEAADRAVSNARRKAETIARLAEGDLDALIGFAVTPPNRIGRFGPQPTVIRSDRPESGNGETAIEGHLDRQEEDSAPSARGYGSAPPPPALMRSDMMADEIIVTGSRVSRAYARRQTFANGGAARSDQDGFNTGGSTNALTMSLMSGPQTIRVTATLSYAYPTLLDGALIVETED